MKTQQSFVLIAILLVLAASTILAVADGTEVVAVATMAEDAEPDQIDEPILPRKFDAKPVAIAQRDTVAQAFMPGGPPPTSGTIYGRLSQATDVIGEYSSYTIVVRELINPNSRQVGQVPFERMKSFKVDPHRTPRFVIADIPFSRYSYDVELFVTGFNGSKRTVQLSASHPVAGTPDFAEYVGEEIVLSLSPGVPFSLRLHDQYFNPIVGRDFVMEPIGDPRGRIRYPGNTDGFGTMIFENVLRGDYDVNIDQTVVARVTVYATKKVTLQGNQIMVPMGNDLRVEVNNRIGYGLEGINLAIYAVDTTENRRYEAQTDYTGVHTFPHLLAGTYQIDIWGSGYQRTSRKVRLTQDGPYDTVTVRLSSQ